MWMQGSAGDCIANQMNCLRTQITHQWPVSNTIQPEAADWMLPFPTARRSPSFAVGLAALRIPIPERAPVLLQRSRWSWRRGAAALPFVLFPSRSWMCLADVVAALHICELNSVESRKVMNCKMERRRRRMHLSLHCWMRVGGAREQWETSLI